MTVTLKNEPRAKSHYPKRAMVRSAFPYKEGIHVMRQLSVQETTEKVKVFLTERAVM